jgi:hypothetical protein
MCHVASPPAPETAPVLAPKTVPEALVVVQEREPCAVRSPAPCAEPHRPPDDSAASGMSAAEFEELLASWQARYSELEALYEHVRKEYHELSSRTAEPCAPSTEPVEEDEHVKLTPDSATEQLPPSNDLVRSSARAGLTLFEHPTALVMYVLLTGTGTFIILYAMCCTSQAKGYGRLADLEEGKPRASHTPKSVPKTALERQHPPPPKPAEPRPTKPVDLSERGKLRVLLQRAEGLNDARALLLGKSDPYVILKAGALGALLLPHLPPPRLPPPCAAVAGGPDADANANADANADAVRCCCRRRRRRRRRRRLALRPAAHASHSKCPPFSGPKQEQKSSTIHADLNPIWNESFEFPGLRHQFITSGLLLRLFDYDEASQDDHLADVTVSLEPLRTRQRISTSHTFKAELPYKGAVYLMAEWIPDDAPPVQLPMALDGSAERQSGTLRILLERAENLKPSDLNGNRDVYVSFECPRQEAQRSSTKYKTLNPIWNECIEFRGYRRDLCGNPQQQRGLKLKVMDWDGWMKAKADDPLGEVQLPFIELHDALQCTYEVKLPPPFKGVVHLSAEWLPDADLDGDGAGASPGTTSPVEPATQGAAARNGLAASGRRQRSRSVSPGRT